MLEDRIKEKGIDCCVNEVGVMIQNLVRTLRIFEREEIVSEGFTISQCYIMIYLLKNKSLTMNEISEKMNLDKSTITRIVSNLVRDGYIEKKTSHEDGRVILASLTAAGKQKAVDLQSKVNNYYKQVIGQIPEGEVMEVVSSVNYYVKS
ncbi:DNA-binding MarR family transcriptional regulator [Halanaerobium saccharolyticum]|uniref:DNA-binding MarR family transcriptional regulator n=1 Tax=Halanaerobium saccharolyticum TaxID=43595 RepID=A0A4R7YUB7_9FIRM|nr:MarR family transcriptional regulator [Halanaerobium saccharolyticum]RAK10248.1 DNA-binding MarR family transcriptional regulator [Halanaerobium saccharolyticum]TDW00460.1 DNA-binding MarR family transcriptional regulator [Halanaerobium saccharolyticum]TDX52045.1 DNA-binding MarR family transcriptional regulator [Halanaerobium saccharolyticum]